MTTYRHIYIYVLTWCQRLAVKVFEQDLETDQNYEYLKVYILTVIRLRKDVPNRGEHQAAILIQNITTIIRMLIAKGFPVSIHPDVFRPIKFYTFRVVYAYVALNHAHSHRDVYNTYIYMYI